MTLDISQDITLEKLREQIPDFARDTKLNLEALLKPEPMPGLSAAQVAAVALSCAYATAQPELAAALRTDFAISAETDHAAKGAATIMAMNNVYYRSMHLLEDKEIGKLPARLRMNIIGKPGIERVDFELMGLAISAIGGCGMCLNAHVQELQKAGITQDGIHSALRLASVVNSAKLALTLQ